MSRVKPSQTPAPEPNTAELLRDAYAAIEDVVPVHLARHGHEAVRRVLARSADPGDFFATTTQPDLEPAMAGARAEGADMAALLFELSSLGGAFDNDADTSPTGAKVTTRPLQADTSEHKPKKRKLFGR